MIVLQCMQVHEAVLGDLVYPTEIVGKRVRYRLDGSKLLKVRLRPPEAASELSRCLTHSSLLCRQHRRQLQGPSKPGEDRLGRLQSPCEVNRQGIQAVCGACRCTWTPRTGIRQSTS